MCVNVELVYSATEAPLNPRVPQQSETELLFFPLQSSPPPSYLAVFIFSLDEELSRVLSDCKRCSGMFLSTLEVLSIEWGLPSVQGLPFEVLR